MSKSNDGAASVLAGLIVFGGAGIVIVGAIAFLFWVGPQYGLYSARMDGEAQLKKAESTRQVRVLESKAKADAAELEAKAKLIQADADAKAFAVIGEQIQKNPGILQYEYIKGLQDKPGDQPGDRMVIYVPTQNGLPVLPVSEAGRAIEPKK